MQASQKTMENFERVGRQEQPGFELDTLRLQVKINVGRGTTTNLQSVALLFLLI